MFNSENVSLNNVRKARNPQEQTILPSSRLALVGLRYRLAKSCSLAEVKAAIHNLTWKHIKELTIFDAELDGASIVEVKLKNGINKQCWKRNDGGHETQPIDMKEIDEEAYYGGRPTEDVLNDEETFIKYSRRPGAHEKHSLVTPSNMKSWHIPKKICNTQNLEDLQKQIPGVNRMPLVVLTLVVLIPATRQMIFIVEKYKSVPALRLEIQVRTRETSNIEVGSETGTGWGLVDVTTLTFGYWYRDARGPYQVGYIGDFKVTAGRPAQARQIWAREQMIYALGSKYNQFLDSQNVGWREMS
ncbi:hypothetical protein EDD18DRAFT_1105717 [Armillaria luteobubalina]|uniref:Uncharacterized protein n=1 Tax=Armillaria luteobubalina TaxID=153913 RepID=A0AA39Q805_9AGAR|nr:hypothetical protein EDD18DRAFT_1105717 [Armillaria luteobubalina]